MEIQVQTLNRVIFNPMCPLSASSKQICLESESMYTSILFHSIPRHGMLDG